MTDLFRADPPRGRCKADGCMTLAGSDGYCAACRDAAVGDLNDRIRSRLHQQTPAQQRALERLLGRPASEGADG